MWLPVTSSTGAAGLLYAPAATIPAIRARCDAYLPQALAALDVDDGDVVLVGDDGKAVRVKVTYA